MLKKLFGLIVISIFIIGIMACSEYDQKNESESTSKRLLKEEIFEHPENQDKVTTKEEKDQKLQHEDKNINRQERNMYKQNFKHLSNQEKNDIKHQEHRGNKETGK
ncbi:MAG: hypothetical protein HQK91_00345 [Nitrospirae bacterium]|nr:hypothetical protein [Nitrospirota bacterium]MBF0539885.1 hypothetical protein [Nitrospirota bacterium]